MRFNEDAVQRASDWATEVTGGQFELGPVCGDIGYGTRYTDGVEQLVWLGRTGAREAAAYYLAAGAAWAELSGATVPDVHAEALAYLTGAKQPPAVRKAADRGTSTGRHRFANPIPALRK